MGFVFFDLRTTGTDSAFDQLVQFAAIHTDANLNVLDRFEHRCRLLPHIVPSPSQLVLNGTPIGHLVDPALPSHYDMTREIATQLTAWSPAIFVGWGSLEDGEHFLRQALYQNLHYPYLTTTPGNGRCDLKKLAQALTALQPNALATPIDANGEYTFELGSFAHANNVSNNGSGDAAGSAETILRLCRLILDRSPDHWSTTIRFAQKASAVSFVESASAFIATECYFGRPYQYALTKIGVDKQGAVLTYNLEVNPAELQPLTAPQLRARLDQRIKPVRRIRTNAAPILHEVDDYESFLGLSAEKWLARGAQIQADTELCTRLCEAAARPPSKSEHVEKQIYETFSGDADKARMKTFHASTWADRATMIEAFDDPRLVELGYRVLFYNAPEYLSPERCSEIERQLAERALGHGLPIAPWITLWKAETDANALLPICSTHEVSLLTELRLHLTSERERCLARLQ